MDLSTEKKGVNMKTLILILILIFLSACTTTTITRIGPDGESTFSASNTSLGWDREDVNLEVIRTPDGIGVKVGIGKSGGSEGLKRAIKALEDGLAALKGLRP